MKLVLACATGLLTLAQLSTHGVQAQPQVEDFKKMFSDMTPEQKKALDEMNEMIRGMEPDEKKEFLAGMHETFGYNRECPRFQCEEGYEPVQAEIDYRALPECAPWTGLKNMMDLHSDDIVPASTHALTGCCNEMMACYQSCGRLESSCRKQFDKCSTETCATGGGKQCLSGAKTIVSSIKMSKCHVYHRAQKNVCSCARAKDAAGIRAKALTDFFADVDPSRDLSNMLVKATDAKKFAQLVAKIALVYPQSIVNVNEEDLYPDEECAAPEEEDDDDDDDDEEDDDDDDDDDDEDED